MGGAPGVGTSVLVGLGGFEKNRKMGGGTTTPLWETLESGHIKKFVR